MFHRLANLVAQDPLHGDASSALAAAYQSYRAHRDSDVSVDEHAILISRAAQQHAALLARQNRSISFGGSPSAQPLRSPSPLPSPFDQGTGAVLVSPSSPATPATTTTTTAAASPAPSQTQTQAPTQTSPAPAQPKFAATVGSVSIAVPSMGPRDAFNKLLAQSQQQQQTQALPPAAAQTTPTKPQTNGVIAEERDVLSPLSDARR